MGGRLDRAQLLMSQSRYDLAERELQLQLAEDPQDSTAHAILSLCLSERGELAGAESHASSAVHLAPDHPFPHYVMAVCRVRRNRLEDARKAIGEAIRLDPEDPDLHNYLAAILCDQGRWEEALSATSEALRLDPEHVMATDLRARCLMQLRRLDEASASVNDALRLDPENPHTHATKGWAQLHRGETAAAFSHFREALRLDPNSERAREGLVEAMKARNPIYALFLRYFLWTSTLGSKAYWGLILAGWLGYQFLRRVSRAQPETAPWIFPVLGTYVLFVYSTWIANPLFNLILRLDRFGRMALSEEEVRASNWLAACLFAGLALGIGCVVTSSAYMGILAILSLLLAIPLTAAYRLEARKTRTLLFGLAGLATLLVTVGLGGTLLTGEIMIGVILGVVGFIVCGASSWIAAFALRRGY